MAHWERTDFKQLRQESSGNSTKVEQGGLSLRNLCLLLVYILVEISLGVAFGWFIPFIVYVILLHIWLAARFIGGR